MSDSPWSGRARSFDSAWCQMRALCTPTPRGVSTVWDAGFRVLLAAPVLSATMRQERPENGPELHWTNPSGPDPPAEVAPPAAEPVIEDAFWKAAKLSTLSSSWREEGLPAAPKKVSEISDPLAPTVLPRFEAVLCRCGREHCDLPSSYSVSEQRALP